MNSNEKKTELLKLLKSHPAYGSNFPDVPGNVTNFDEYVQGLEGTEKSAFMNSFRSAVENLAEKTSYVEEGKLDAALDALAAKAALSMRMQAGLPGTRTPINERY